MLWDLTCPRLFDSIRNLRNSVMMITPQWEVLKWETQCLCATSAHNILIQMVVWSDSWHSWTGVLHCWIARSSSRPSTQSITSAIIHQLSHRLGLSPSQTPPKTFLMTWLLWWPAWCHPLLFRLSDVLLKPTDSLIGGFQLIRGLSVMTHDLVVSRRSLHLWPDLFS